MEFNSRFKIRKKTKVLSETHKLFFDSESHQVEFNAHDELVKIAPKDTKDIKITQEKKNVTINVDLLKAAFLALGQFGFEEEGKDEAQQEINLSFSALSYSVKQGIKREAKHILENLHGEFLAGELTAIVGPSGSGKSSLLKILAGFTTNGVTGSIKINNNERDLTSFVRRSCYIMQNDDLSPFLTAEEAMTMAANLKLESKITKKKNTVLKILESLGLLDCRQVLTGKLSGGQRKRLSIALELLNNPPVMFLDEPTSGLDSSSSKQCITLLKDLARSGRTVICSLHQPSASLFEMFDHLYVMRDGNCLYSGDTKELLPFLSECGLQCPHYYNPADFVLEVATMAEYNQEVPKLVKKIKNGKCHNWRKLSKESDKNLENRDETGENKKDVSSNAEETASAFINRSTESCRTRVDQHTYPTSFWRQFYIILINNFKKLSRNMFFVHLQLLIHAIAGVLIGFLFYDIGNDAVYLLDNFGLLFFCLMWNMFTSYSTAVSFYPQERPILIREHFNKWYSLRAYFFATNIVNLPVQVVCAMLFTSISYFLTSQPIELHRFVKFTLIILLLVLVGQGFGYLVGSAMNIQHASIFGSLLIAPFLLFSGYFVLLVDSPDSLKWLFHMSYYKYALEGVMDAVFGDNRKKMKCSGDYCHFKVPQTFLKQLGMDRVDYWLNFSLLLGLSIILRVLSYFILRFRLNYFRC